MGHHHMNHVIPSMLLARTHRPYYPAIERPPGEANCEPRLCPSVPPDVMNLLFPGLQLNMTSKLNIDSAVEASAPRSCEHERVDSASTAESSPSSAATGRSAELTSVPLSAQRTLQRGAFSAPDSANYRFHLPHFLNGLRLRLAG
jgi:hypothetical protein